MYNEHWLRIEIEKWLLKKGWAVTVAVLTLAVMAMTALAAALWVVLTVVLFPLAVRFTRWAEDTLEDVVLDNDWPTLGLIPSVETWQQVALAAMVWAVLAAVPLLVWLVVSILLLGLQEVLPAGYAIPAIIGSCVVVGIVSAFRAAAEDDAEDDASGIFLG